MAKRIDATPERIASLPEWARNHIQNLERKVSESKKELRSYLETAKPSEFAIRRYVDGGPILTYLPEGSTIVAFLDKDHEEDLHDRRGLELRVQGLDESWSASGGIPHLEVASWHRYPAVTGQAANVLRVRLLEEF